MRVYEVRLRVDADNLTTVLDVVKDSADLISMTQVVDANPPPRKRVHQKQEVQRPKGVTAQSLILKELDGRNPSIEHLEKVFSANGFAKTSARVAINELVRNGVARKIAEGVYGK